MAPRHKRIGEILLRDRKITAGQLEQALDAQVMYGGRLGTNLVELDLLPILELGRALSEQRGVPEAVPDDFMAASPRLLDQFPRDLAATFKVFPLRVEQKILHLAMIDPQDQQQIDKITFVVGLRIKACVAPELRLHFFLEQRLGIPRDKRFLRVREDAEEEDPRRSYLEPTVSLSFAPPDRDGAVSGELTPVTRARPSGVDLPAVAMVPPSSGSGTYRAASSPDSELPDWLEPVAPHAGPDPNAPEPGAVRGVAPRRGPSAGEPGAEDDELVFLDHAMRASARLPRVPTDEFEVTIDEPEVDADAEASRLALPDPSPARPRGAAASRAASAAPPVPVPVPVPVPAPKASAVPRPSGVEAICAALDRAAERDAVARVLVEPVLPQAALTVLFLVRGEMAIALAANGTLLAEEEVRRLVLPLASSTFLREACTSGEVVQGLAQTDPLQQVIAGYLQGPAPEEACVVPIAVGKRVINLLCVQTPSGSPLGASALEELRRVGEHAAAAYARLIREVKGKAGSD